MKTFLRPNAGRGFSLIELMVAMGISVVLMAALASIFATSVSTREKIDLEGQKIETARYSLDTLAEDIRLAGYFGSLAPSLPPQTGVTTNIVDGATPVDWKYVAPCSVAAGDLPGWSTAADQATPATNVEVPMPIFGYEAHDTGPLTATDLTGCLDNYKTDTDVFVIRRASTAAVTVGGTGYVSGEAYLQTSTCPEGAVDASAKYPPRFLAKATTTSADYNLHMLGCTPTVAGAISSVRKLITRIYYISNCYDCAAADGIPTLKVAFLTTKSAASKKADGVTLRSANCVAKTNATDLCIDINDIAPGVENMHLEYGIDTTDDGSVDAWVQSNDDPRQTGSTGDAVTGMRLDANTENRWEDVMAIKLFLITRDLKTTSGFASPKTFTMGTVSRTMPADGYRRRMTSTTVKLTNMSGRRDVP